MKLIRIAPILFLLCFFYACDTKNQEEKSESISKEIKNKSETFDPGNFKCGAWRIDSVGENEQVIDRMSDDSSFIQGFNFRNNGKFSTLEINPGVVKDRVVGSWIIEKDSLYVLSEKGNIAMRYGYEFLKDVLVLKGNFEISSKNKKKPVFYLSKYTLK
jgi:hypothetical protein